MADRSVLLFGGWTLGLVTVTVLYRVVRSLVLRDEKINAWPRGTPNPRDPGIISRITDAHANSLEMLPVLVAVVLAAHVSGRVSTIDSLASFIFPLRVLQSLTHAVGTSQLLVFFRANFYTAQVALVFLMLAKLL
jgi:uncharacterized MAPEG superfamily protein